MPGPYGRKLAQILSLFTADGEHDGLRLCLQIPGDDLKAALTALPTPRRVALGLVAWSTSALTFAYFASDLTDV